jgi:DNA-binding transcriptional LysR family regulator
MKLVHLAAVDLNLLVVLDALLREGSATRAAKRLGRTQSAISHALPRLRDVFGDPLFVRVGPALRPTPRADALRAPLAELLERATGLLGGDGELDPRRLERTFVVGSTDLFDNTALPALLTALATEAPLVSVTTKGVGEHLERALQQREVDIALVAHLETQAGLSGEALFTDVLRLMLRRGHPALRRPMTLDAYCALSHVLVAPKGGDRGPVDQALADLGRQRHITLRTPSFTAALRVVAATDLVVALPARFARTAPRSVVVRKLPLPDIGHSFQLAWSQALEHDAGHRWFRNQLRQAVLSAYRKDTRGLVPLA